jgi:hypothetical protein
MERRLMPDNERTMPLTLFICACALVVAGCLVPNRWLPRLPNDKLMHFGAFAGLAALALAVAGSRTEGALLLGALLVGGWAIECLQQLVPDRSFCWRDIAANAGGIGLVGACGLLYSLLGPAGVRLP